MNTKAKNEAYYNSKVKYEQMSKQQQLIEQKKLEIQKRLEEKKKKETEEALKKLNEGKQKANDPRSKRNFYGCYSKSKNLTGDRVPENEPTLPANIFSNDGSFFQQFQKISGIKVEVKKKSGHHAKITSSNEDLKNEGGNKQYMAFEGNEKGMHAEDNEKHSSKAEIPNQNQLIHQHQQIIQQNPHLIQQQTIPNQTMQQHHPIMPHQQQMLRPPLHQQVFTPQQMPMPPMNFTPQFNPMQCGMMLPPPMTPSSIPPPAPLNPGLIPSPSPLQPCSIPSPSPLQPYAIPPPSPLLPHSIPPPSPMVPHSIPPPSPLTPHSIPPPLPLRPQSIPPPVQRPPMFLSMAPPPPPPPPEEEERPEEKSHENQEEESEVNPKVEPNEKVKRFSPSPPPTESNTKTEMNIEDNVKDLFKNDEYSSSSDEEEKEPVYGPSNKKEISSDSESDYERKDTDSNSDKESDVESNHKIGSYSESDSDTCQDFQQAPKNEPESTAVRQPQFGTIVVEDTETQFPSDNKDSSCLGESAPPDISSEGDSQSDHPRGSDNGSITSRSPQQSEPQVKFEPIDLFGDNFGENVTQAHNTNLGLENNMELKNEIKTEVNSEIKTEASTEMKTEANTEVKTEANTEVKTELQEKNEIKYTNFVKENQADLTVEGPTNFPDSTVKSEEPPKKKRKSRWATNDDVIAPMPPMIPMPPMLPMPPLPPSSLPIQLPTTAVGPIGVVAPKVLGGVNMVVPPLPPSTPCINVPGMSGPLISKLARSDPALIAYAMKSYGHTNLNEAEWKKVEDHYKINLLYQDMMRKREELERLQAAGKNKYEYDSDEDTHGGTWEHKLRSAEMEATQLWADELTEQAKGKHHIGDFLPPDELARFMEKYEALKDGREPDLSDYKEFKLKEDNVGFQMLQKLGWTEGQGLGPDGSGIMDPVNKATMRPENQGLGVERPEDVEADDDEYDAYRKRMMLAYRFRPNPMNNPRRPYY